MRRLGKGREVIFDVKCSDALVETLERVGAKPTMWMTGHSFIKRKMKESGAVLAGEMSGHMFFGPPDYLGFDDALYAAARLLQDRGGPAAAALRAARRAAAVRVHPRDPGGLPRASGRPPSWRPRRSTSPSATRPSRIDGVRWRTADGWGLIRASNTQPLLVLRFEARSAAGLETIRREAEQVLRAQGVGGLA